MSVTLPDVTTDKGLVTFVDATGTLITSTTLTMDDGSYVINEEVTDQDNIVHLMTMATTALPSSSTINLTRSTQASDAFTLALGLVSTTINLDLTPQTSGDDVGIVIDVIKDGTATPYDITFVNAVGGGSITWPGRSAPPDFSDLGADQLRIVAIGTVGGDPSILTGTAL